MKRIEDTFRELRKKNKRAFVSFVMAGDPDIEKSLELVMGLPSSGVDIIELGVPFTDPMADGGSIQLAGQRALKSGTNLDKVLNLVDEFRATDKKTPIVLMGYYNPIYFMGVNKFLSRCKAVGVDGLIIVDLPPEEDSELCLPAKNYDIDFIRLATPTSDDKRLNTILNNASGFLYYVSITGITGAAAATKESVQPELERIRKKTSLPICVGFGIKNAQAAREIAEISDGVVIGSAIVEKIGRGESIKEILKFCKTLAEGANSK